jgi:hypothetical protein
LAGGWPGLLQTAFESICQLFPSFAEMKNLSFIQPNAAAAVAVVDLHSLFGQNGSQLTCLAGWAIHCDPFIQPSPDIL